MPKWKHRPKEGNHRIAIPSALAIKVRLLARTEGRTVTGQVIFMLGEAMELRRSAKPDSSTADKGGSQK